MRKEAKKFWFLQDFKKSNGWNSRFRAIDIIYRVILGNCPRMTFFIKRLEMHKKGWI